MLSSHVFILTLSFSTGAYLNATPCCRHGQHLTFAQLSYGTQQLLSYLLLSEPVLHLAHLNEFVLLINQLTI